MSGTYTHGHHDAVLRSHRWRTAENSAGYLLPHLRPGMSLLDVGCGPGTITVDLASRVAPGQVVAIDAAAEVIAEAESLRTAAVANVTFTTGDVYALDYADASFDVVHAHQVLQHLNDPVAALTEMRRVLVPAGLLAVRDGDYAAFIWFPADPLLTRWMELYYEVTARNGGQAGGGRYLLSWVRQAGFSDVTVSCTSWTYADPESRHWWGDLWADRVEHSSFGRQAVDYGLSDVAELSAIGSAFRRWSEADDGIFVVPSVEVLARR